MVPALRAEETEFAGFPVHSGRMKILDVTLEIYYDLFVFSLPTDERGDGVLGFIASPAAD